LGRIKPKILKGFTKEMMEKHGDKLDTDFEKNKEVLKKYVDVQSKKLRNVIAGYAARLKKSEK
jgi:small subunit ribosomal protein S17e